MFLMNGSYISIKHYNTSATHVLPSVGFPELKHQQEALRQARDWNRGDLAKVPSSLSSRSSLGFVKLNNILMLDKLLFYGLITVFLVKLKLLLIYMLI